MDASQPPKELSAMRVPPGNFDRLISLTPRETEVLELICDGLGDVEIALRCGITSLTVRHHVRNIYSKLGVSRRSHAVVHAIQSDLVTPAWLSNRWVRRHVTA